MKKLLKLLFILAALAVLARAMRDRMLPAPEAPTSAAPPFRPAPSGDSAAATTPKGQGAKPATTSPTMPGADDLTAINGIGPAFAKRLAEIGITTFAELATSNAVDVSNQIDVPVSRVEDWIGQAADRTS